MPIIGIISVGSFNINLYYCANLRIFLKILQSRIGTGRSVNGNGGDGCGGSNVGDGSSGVKGSGGGHSGDGPDGSTGGNSSEPLTRNNMS